MRTLLIFSLLAVTAFAGCVDDEAGGNAGTSSGATGIMPADVDLVHGESKKSLAVHPAFGYPTFSDYTGLTVDVPEAWVVPAYNQLPEQVTGFEHLAQVDNVSAAAGIAVFGHYVFASGNGPGVVVDIADPAAPVKVADLETGIRDADIIAHPDGRLTLVAASNGPIFLYDVTDPTNPVELQAIEDLSSHNAAVVPGTPIVYNANSCGGQPETACLGGPQASAGQGTGVTEIYDLTDPENPVEVQVWQNGYGCHDITFFIDTENEKYRAYCAGIEMTQIWDIADPLNPVVIANIPVHHGVADSPSGTVPVVLFSHLAMVNADASILIVGDESGGGLANACDANADAQAQTVAGPTGNLWFYDISDETNPVLKSMLNPNNPATQDDYRDQWQSQVQDELGQFTAEPSPGGVIDLAFNAVPAGCTAHFGRIIEDKEQMVISFYGAGSLLVDFSDPAHPVILDQFSEGGNTWDIWEFQGYAITGDLIRGVDILRLV